MSALQSEKAAIFRAQHLSGKLVILPNIWDVVGAKLMQVIGYPSVATASVATAMANGYSDGQKIPFQQLLNIVKNISEAVTIPLTVDIERGFAGNLAQLKENIRLLIMHGAVGINIEDSLPEHSGFESIEYQCRKIEAIREAGILFGVPIFINARTDIFLLKVTDRAMEQATERARAYKSAGADCIYPITIGSYEDISRFSEATSMPVNVNLHTSISDIRKLESIGVARISLGPQLLNHALSTMKQVSEDLLKFDSATFFSRQLLSREFMDRLT
jgi:2-methylisocitrate lyase-like PEP mutase family enzyme